MQESEDEPRIHLSPAVGAVLRLFQAVLRLYQRAGALIERRPLMKGSWWCAGDEPGAAGRDDGAAGAVPGAGRKGDGDLPGGAEGLLGPGQQPTVSP